MTTIAPQQQQQNVVAAPTANAPAPVAPGAVPTQQPQQQQSQQPGGVAPSYPMASLYVGDLHPDVNESQLFDKFSSAGAILSIRVCRDAVSRRSLGYAYVNFQQPADAERALDTMNFDLVAGKPIRIMWSQRDPAIRRSGAGNIYIKNLDRHIDTKALYDTFSMFGTILSCKVAVDAEGQSKGYAFIHFESGTSATEAINKVNGMLLEGRKVFVGKFLPRNERDRQLGDDGVSRSQFTNVFVKNFGELLDKEGLEKLASQYGTVLSSAVAVDADGKNKGFGFIAFSKPEEAEAAVEGLNGHEVGSGEEARKLIACRAQKKSERAAELASAFAQKKAERMQRYQGVNLYVKNLDDSIDDAQLSEQFSQFGEVTSAKVMREEGEGGRSKGFGFVCFSKPDDATKAVVELNNKLVGSKPLYVALAQRKEDRKAALASQYMQRLASIRLQGGMGGIGGMPGMYPAASGGFFIPGATLQGQQRFMAPGQMPGAAPMRGGGGAPRWNAMGAAGFNPMQMQAQYMQGYGQQQQQMGGGGGGRGGPRVGGGGGMRPQYGQQQMGGGGGMRPQQQMGGGRMQGLQQQQQYGGGQPGMRQLNNNSYAGGPQQGIKPGMMGQMPPIYSAYPAAYPPQMMGGGMQQQQPQQRPMGVQQQQQAGIVVHNQEPLTTQSLASATPQEQKQMLGERLYPLIARFCNESTSDVGKVTGMMLEMENGELLMMLENEELLEGKVNEALNVLASSKGAAA